MYKKILQMQLTSWTEALVTFSIIGAFLFSMRVGYNNYQLKVTHTNLFLQAQELGLHLTKPSPFSQQFPTVNAVISIYGTILLLIWVIVGILWGFKIFSVFSRK